MQKEFSESFFTSAGEADPEGELSFTILIGRIIEIATRHANSLNIGNPMMEDIGGGWVLGRVTVQMTDYPSVNTSYTITTWIEDWNRLFSTRCFRIEGTDGRIFGYVRTVWMVINLTTHENIGLTHLTLPENMISQAPCPIPVQKRHKPDSITKIATHTFSYTDLDFYRHVNTLRWIGLILDRYSLEDFDKNYIYRFEISFKHEGTYGMNIEICSAQEKDSEADGWILTHDGEPLVQSRIILKPRDSQFIRT